MEVYEKSSGRLVTRRSELENFLILCHVNLVDADSLEDQNFVRTETHMTRAKRGDNRQTLNDYLKTLSGNTVCTGQIVYLGYDTFEIRFEFNDLSVRVLGRFKFKCIFIVPSKSTECCTLLTSEFEIKPASGFTSINLLIQNQNKK